MPEVIEEKKTLCHHCGDLCLTETITYDEKSFCCNGCQAVYQLFKETDLEDIYLDANKLKPENNHKYAYLENQEIAESILDFNSVDHASFRVSLPAIHCSSCIYLLENIHLFNSGIIRSSINFSKKEGEIHFNPEKTSLKEVAEMLDRIGYPPTFSHENQPARRNPLSIKIGVAAFCFGNIMLLSFPEYLGFDGEIDASFKMFFSYLNIALVLPVVIYSARDYFLSAIRGLQHRFITIDVPIALGIITLFGRSLYEIISQTGAGYLDSLAGLVFFLLIGKWFQNKTYENLSFERDYKSYFPLAAYKKNGEQLEAVPIADLKKEDIIIIRNQEIIPADAILLSDSAALDYSFVTGEEKLIEVQKGEKIYAGGRLSGSLIEVRLINSSSQSYLTSLWNNQVFVEKGFEGSEALTNRISKYFTFIILMIALISGIFWFAFNPEKTWQVVSAILIVACPCALALAAPFTNGNLVRIFGRNKFYLKEALTAEKLDTVDTLVFDKTGTLTQTQNSKLTFFGDALSTYEESLLWKLTENSIHPKSQILHHHLRAAEQLKLDAYEEVAGKGIAAIIDGHEVQLGNNKFANTPEEDSGKLFFSIDNKIRGYFMFSNAYRNGIENLINRLGHYDLHVLSGDNSIEEAMLRQLFPSKTVMKFNQQPQDKLEYIKELQARGKKVLMLGDGLNDAGALKQADVGVAITDDVSSFSPACDAILEGANLKQLATFLNFSKSSKNVLIWSFIISFIYNFIGISFAVMGWLTPLFAAILMPLSSITVVGFTTFLSNTLAKQKQLI